MSPLIPTEYNTIIDYNNYYNYNHTFNDEDDEEQQRNQIYSKSKYFTYFHKESIIIKYLYYLCVMIIAVIIEMYLLSKFLTNIINNTNIETIDYLY